jgi:hypothetical protein
MSTTPPVRQVVFRGWPGLDHYQAPTVPTGHADRLGDKAALVLAAAAEVGQVPERFGVGAFMEIAGPSVIRAGIIVPDRLEHDDPAALDAIAAWVDTQPLSSPKGRLPREIVTLGSFFHPRTGLFARRTYSGAGWCIGADLGRTFGICAEHCLGRNEPHADGFEVWLPGWGKKHDRGRWKRASPHRPPLRVTSHRVGWRVEFGPCEKDHGKRVNGRMWRGAFLDVLSVAYALDADRSASFVEHGTNLGLDMAELPLTVTVDPDGACAVARAATNIHALALILDRVDVS